jgi:hypothetical protein
MLHTAPRVSSIGLEPNVRSFLLVVGHGLTLLIPLGLGPVIRANGLPRLPSMDHGEVLVGFSTKVYLKKNTRVIHILQSNLLLRFDFICNPIFPVDCNPWT